LIFLPVIVSSLIFLFVIVAFLMSLAVMLPSLMSLPVIIFAAVATPADPAKAITATMAIGAMWLGRGLLVMGIPSARGASSVGGSNENAESAVRAPSVCAQRAHPRGDECPGSWQEGLRVTTNVRRHQRTRAGPQRMVRRQRLWVRHVQGCPQSPCGRLDHQGLGVYQRPAPDVDQQRAIAHRR
jgi:hypothetical protein